MKATKKDNILPLRKSDPFCNTKSPITNAIFMAAAFLYYPETEEKTLKAICEVLADYFESYQDENLIAELLYHDTLKLMALIDVFQSEATICPNCKSFNIAVEETDDETFNTCLDCQNSFISE